MSTINDIIRPLTNSPNYNYVCDCFISHIINIVSNFNL